MSPHIAKLPLHASCPSPEHSGPIAYRQERVARTVNWSARLPKDRMTRTKRALGATAFYRVNERAGREKT
ncbi:hypothetical protein PHSY_006324 [Pseudozyma hubeiensis SY62]|uniref:Uncharacterized protein n=1 Tax=Pseudozyma hubeiensis (strain SY62) TaxID=1305764 RepID=R9PKU5_PSEHS|nr:hypothetical protein PHSY_006324 [Pseudozyma hubeiensis SY62]GAC98730.1 hypothetical protein PHSY_006324 [Pseudozyma hubeiensis SY62]